MGDIPPVPKAKPTEKDYETLKKWYTEEVERKDRMIEHLKKENTLLIKSSLKTSERLADMQGIRDKEYSNRVKENLKFEKEKS